MTPTQDQILTGRAPPRWLPVRTFADLSEHNVAVELWAITATCAVPALWAWRRRRREQSTGFDLLDPSTPPPAP